MVPIPVRIVPIPIRMFPISVFTVHLLTHTTIGCVLLIVKVW